MTLIEMDMPKYCARCPMMVVHRGEDFMPTYLCKIKWKELDGEFICKKRAEFCPMKELVMCKDCKHGFRLDDTNYIVCGRPFASNRETHTEEWFCADGKRTVKQNDSDSIRQMGP